MFQLLRFAEGHSESIVIGAGNDKLFKLVAQTLGHDEWATDGRFLTNASRTVGPFILVLLSRLFGLKGTFNHQREPHGGAFYFSLFKLLIGNL